MSRRLKLALGLLIAAPCLLFLWNCEGPEGPSGPAGTTPITVSGSASWSIYSNYSDIELYVSDSPSLPTLLVNGEEKTLQPVSWTNGFRYVEPYSLLQPGDSLHIEIGFTRYDNQPGSAQIHTILPDTFRVWLPDTSEYISLPLGEDLVLNWTPSAGAEDYAIQGYMVYHYLDTAGVARDTSFGLSTVLVDTTWVIAAAALWPNLAAIDSLNSEYGNGGVLYLSAICGPWQSGDPGNVAGDGVGIFTCYTATQPISIVLTN
ncbi:MAG TPA: hypothetical protein VF398_11135 [bacterium]